MLHIPLRLFGENKLGDRAENFERKRLRERFGVPSLNTWKNRSRCFASGEGTQFRHVQAKGAGEKVQLGGASCGNMKLGARYRYLGRREGIKVGGGYNSCKSILIYYDQMLQ